MRRLSIVIGLLAIAALGGLVVIRNNKGDPQPIQADRADQSNSDQLAESAISATPAPATSPAKGRDLPKGYIGTQACAECHQDRYASYLQTAHSRSIREVDIESVQTDAQLVHAISKRSYEIINRNGRLWHREWEHFRASGAEHQAADPKLRLTELPVQYIMGSGNFAEAYLLRDGDYLLQSPVTWYIADGDYGIAPGYDEPVHRGCNRVIDDQCLFCHAGLISRDQPQHPRILELAIGCERCHGPSEKHAIYHQSRAASNDDRLEIPLDAQSLDPAKLERSKLESICAQCHLNGDVVVDADGKSIWDFVPGNDITATRRAYKAEYGKAEDPFTEHFDQMWQSKCYQQSESLTCVTCHDPHHGEPTEDLDQFYRDQCLTCHANEDCGLPLDRRFSEQQNRCVHCHMPATPSEAVHSATTNHRIGIYSAGLIDRPQASSRVVLRRLQSYANDISIDQVSPPADLLAKAYWLLEQNGDAEKTRGLSAADLESELVESIGTGSPKLLSLLARLARYQADRVQSEQESKQHLSRAGQYASQALANQSIGHHERTHALEVLASAQYGGGAYAASLATYQQLVTLRRSAIDHYNLGISFGKLRQFRFAEQAFREAIRIDASYPLPYRSLSILYRSIDSRTSSQMAGMAQSLMQNTPTR